MTSHLLICSFILTFRFSPLLSISLDMLLTLDSKTPIPFSLLPSPGPYRFLHLFQPFTHQSTQSSLITHHGPGTSFNKPILVAHWPKSCQSNRDLVFLLRLSASDT